MDNWMWVVGFGFYFIFGMLLADTLLANGKRWFMVTLFWFPILIMIILSGILLAIGVKVYEGYEKIKTAYKL